MFSQNAANSSQQQNNNENIQHFVPRLSVETERHFLITFLCIELKVHFEQTVMETLSVKFMSLKAII